MHTHLDPLRCIVVFVNRPRDMYKYVCTNAMYLGRDDLNRGRGTWDGTEVF